MYVSKNKKKNKDYYINEDDEDEKKEEDDIINCNWDNEQVNTLYYDDVILFLLFNPDGIRDLLTIKIDDKHVKGH